MLAEIRGKLSQTGSNLHERLEDQLTGNFFGAIRYLPMEIGLFPVLQQAQPISTPMLPRDCFGGVTGYDYQVNFWEKHLNEGEIDVLITTAARKFVLGIEAKYRSGLSSDDPDADQDDVTPEQEITESINQLARYARLLSDRYPDQPRHLMLLAPTGSAIGMVEKTRHREFPPGVVFWLLTWESALEGLKKAKERLLEPGQRLVLQDLIDLLVKKGLWAFRDFVIETPFVDPNAAYSFAPNELRLRWGPIPSIGRDMHYEFLYPRS
jgi:hypothetical protein